MEGVHIKCKNRMNYELLNEKITCDFCKSQAGVMFFSLLKKETLLHCKLAIFKSSYNVDQGFTTPNSTLLWPLKLYLTVPLIPLSFYININVNI